MTIEVCFYNALLLENGRVFVLGASHTKAQNMSQTIPRLYGVATRFRFFLCEKIVLHK